MTSLTCFNNYIRIFPVEEIDYTRIKIVLKKHIIQLIHDDIKISRLINLLMSLDISAGSYYLGNSTFIFALLGIDSHETTQELYNQMIERGENIEKYGTHEKMKSLAEEIYDELFNLAK